jgi:hypothetical protein
MAPSKRAKGKKSSAAGTGTKGATATGTGTSKGTKATSNTDTTKGTKGGRRPRRTKGSDENWIGISKDHLDEYYKERRGRSRRARSPHEADDPTYTPPGGHVTSINPQPRRSPRKADQLGYIDPENIDEDVGSNEEGVFGEDAFDEDVDVIDGVEITSSPNRNKSPKQKAMAKLDRFMKLHGNSPPSSPMEGVNPGAYNVLMAPHRSHDPANVPTVHEADCGLRV